MAVGLGIHKALMCFWPPLDSTGSLSSLRPLYYSTVQEKIMLIDPNLVGDKRMCFNFNGVIYKQCFSQSVLFLQTLKYNYLPQNIIFKIGITRATTYTGWCDVVGGLKMQKITRISGSF